jgi:hypothetical protein
MVVSMSAGKAPKANTTNDRNRIRRSITGTTTSPHTSADASIGALA